MKAGVVMEHPDVDTKQHLAIPETLDFHAEGKGAVPVRLHLRPKEFWLLRNLYVQELRFTRQISTEAGAIAFISTIKKGTVTLHDVAESITLQENEPLTLTGVRGRLVELRGDDTFTLQFEGTCTETLHWSCRRPGESCSLPAEILLSPGATDVFLECRGVHLGHTMEYSQNGLSLRRLRWLAALVVSLSIMVPSAIQAQQAAGETLSLALRSTLSNGETGIELAASREGQEFRVYSGDCIDLAPGTYVLTEQDSAIFCLPYHVKIAAGQTRYFKLTCR
jgi:hypothetical protein